MPGEAKQSKSNGMAALLRHALAVMLNLRLLALHLVLNAVLLVSASFWLLIPEEHVWQLLFAALSALLIVLVFLWLHSATLAYATKPGPAEFRAALSPKLGRLMWMFAGILVLFWCMRAVSGWTDSQWHIAGYLYAKAPSWLRPTGGDSGYFTAIGHLFSVIYWYVLPSAFLPLIAARVSGGGSLLGLRTLRRWQYWLAMGFAALVGVWLPTQILGWIPGTTLREQTVGLVIRLALAYVIATAAWLAATGLVGYFVGPRNDQPPADVLRKAAA
jgi:hypothetical protein